ncbi:MAG: hypothetical protein JNN00_17685 [Chitinophagaceae bacterium]|nr:hypothetical protein [Chitinophagaceae bacterium]
MIKNANSQLSQYNATDHYHKYICGMVLTDGAKALAEMFECFWFLDIICSYHPTLLEHEFQTWRLVVNEDQSAFVEGTDGNENTLIQQKVEYTDFKAREATVWVEGLVILLPSEH